MEKMVLLFLSIWLFGYYSVHLRLSDPSLGNVRFHPEMYFLPVLLPAFTIQNHGKVSARTIHLNIPAFIFHVKNTSKILFSPGFKPKVSGG